MESIPYAQAPGTLEAMLKKIKTASVPEKFSQDFKTVAKRIKNKLLILGTIFFDVFLLVLLFLYVQTPFLEHLFS